jgi:hypothetical protein
MANSPRARSTEQPVPRAVGKGGIDIRARVVEPTPGHGRQPLRQPPQRAAFREAQCGALKPIPPIDPYRVRSVDQHICHVGIAQQRLQPACAAQLWQHSAGGIEKGRVAKHRRLIADCGRDLGWRELVNRAELDQPVADPIDEPFSRPARRRSPRAASVRYGEPASNCAADYELLWHWLHHYAEIVPRNQQRFGDKGLRRCCWRCMVSEGLCRAGVLPGLPGGDPLMAGVLFTHRKKKIGEMPGVAVGIEQRSNDAITAANAATKATKDATKAADADTKAATLAAKEAAKARKLARSHRHRRRNDSQGHPGTPQRGRERGSPHDGRRRLISRPTARSGLM